MMCSHTNTHLSPEAHGVLVYVHYQNTTDHYGNAGTLCRTTCDHSSHFFFAAGRKNNGTLDGLLFIINSVKLHLTA